ncbi:thermonuclease family protein [Prosthecomicrobium sp. N25]|uniref:thermonuclease family protein n=1 Tax=Prosthecomicrobium sp. N25 TaxID=3129254 RepID=UPI0030781126
MRARSARRVAIGTVAVVLAIGAVLVWRLGDNRMPAPRVVIGSEPRPARPDPRPAARVPASAWSTAAFDVLSEPEETDRAFLAPFTLSAPYEIVDSMTFRAGERRIRLGLAKGVRRGDVCFGADGLRFACGLMGRASLANLIRSSPVTCHPLGTAGDGTLVAQCFVNGTDIAAHQIRAGLALPEPGLGGTYQAIAEQAREAVAGAWNGGWRLMDLPDDKRDGLVRPPEGPRGGDPTRTVEPPGADGDQPWAKSQ